MRIAHVITRLILGGAQQNTLLTAAGQAEDFGDEVIVITGPGAVSYTHLTLPTILLV